MSSPVPPRALQIHPGDNVATALSDLAPAEVEVLGSADPLRIGVTESITAGHKLALTRIDAGGPVIKYGVPIGLATTLIQPGQWVHLHNCRSRLDERSTTLDLHTGAPSDTAYV